MTVAEARAEMVRIAREIEAAWDAAKTVHERTRITVARRILETEDAFWNERRDRVLADLAPPVPLPLPAKRGAMVINASAVNIADLRAARITEVAVELNDANLADFATPRWLGFNRGGFYVSRAARSTMAGEAWWLAEQVQLHNLAHLVVDTEAHKADLAGGSLQLTEDLYRELRTALGPSPFPVRNITYGIHQNPTVVNHDALRKWGITPVWEAYDGVGATIGVKLTADWVIDQGWRPANIALGDKSLESDIAKLKDPVTRAPVGEIWLWAPEQAGGLVARLGEIA